MAASEENSALFPIFILTIMALPLVPYTILKLCRAASKKTKSIHCECSVCSRSGKYRKSIFKRVSPSFLQSILFLYLHLIGKMLPLSVAIMHWSYLHLHVFNLLLQISNFTTWSNLTVVLLWVIMGVLVYYIKHISREVNILNTDVGNNRGTL